MKNKPRKQWLVFVNGEFQQAFDKYKEAFFLAYHLGGILEYDYAPREEGK